MVVKKFAISAILAIAMVASVFAFSACTKKNKGNTSTSEELPVVENHGEAGLYYLELDGEDYYLTLSGDSYYMTLGNLSGDYTYDGTEFTFSGSNPTASFEGNYVLVTWNGNAYRFLKNEHYTVTYNTDGGSDVDADSVLNGKTVEKPYDPSKRGYDFVGWYADPEYKTPFAFDSDPIFANTTVYARFVEKTGNSDTFTAYLYGRDGTVDYIMDTIGGVLYDLPTYEDASFLGWYSSAYDDSHKLTAKYEGQALYENTSLYAVFAGDVPQPSVTATGVAWASAGANVNYDLTIKAPDGKTVSYNGGLTSYPYDFASKDAGEYEVTLSVKGKTATSYYKNKALAKVSNFYEDGNTIRFNAVPNADKYYIYVECGNEYNPSFVVDNGTSLYYNFENCEMTAMGISFKIEAVADGYMSSVSQQYNVNRSLSDVTGLFVNDSDVLVWDGNPIADKYYVYISGQNYDGYENVGTATSYSLKNYSGELEITVHAFAKGYNPGTSETLHYNKATLAAPQGVEVSGTTLSWEVVEGATGYEVAVGGKTYTVTDNSFDLSNVSVKGATFTVKALAANESNNSAYSDAFKLKAEDENDAPKYVAGYLVWDYAVGANFYEVKVNDSTLTKVEDANSLAITLTKAGANKVELRHNYGQNFYTDWVAVEVYAYEISFDVRGGAAMAPMYKAVGDTLVLPEASAIGYDFASWYLVPGGADVNGKAFTSTTYDVPSNLTLYAYYQPKEYTVSFDFSDAGANLDGTTEATVKYMKGYTLPVPEATDQTKGFGGWYTEPYGYGIKYTDELGDSYYPWRDVSDMTLYAYWVDKFEFLPINNGTAYSVMGMIGIKNLSYLKIPASYNGLPVTTVEGGAFIGAIRLETIEIPNTVTNIEVNTAFSGCNTLKELVIYDAKAEFPDDTAVQNADLGNYYTNNGVLFKINEEEKLELQFFPRALTGSYEIPYGTEVIPANVFQNSSKLNEIIIPSSVTTISTNAFYYCSGLTRVAFKETVGDEDVPLAIAAKAFSYCTSLESIKFPQRLSSFDSTMFNNCAKLNYVEVDGTEGSYVSKDGVLFTADEKTLVFVPMGYAPAEGEYAIPVGIEEIGEYAFASNTNLKIISVPASVKKIHPYAFKSCSRITEVIFAGNSAEEASLEICEHAFDYCSRLSEITLPDYLNKVGEAAFYGCSRLETVTVLSKGDVEFENGSFMSYAGKSAVKTLNIGPDLGVIEINGIFGSSIVNISIDEGNENYSIVDGVVFNKDITAILYYPLGKVGEYSIPETIVSIAGGVFRGKDNLTKITIGKQIENIGDYAFEGCEKLEEVVFEDGREADLEIGAYAFANIPVTTLTLPEKTTVIKPYAFAGSALETISIPSTVAYMGAYEEEVLTALNVFDNCYNLYGLTIDSANTHFGTDASGALYLKTENVPTELIFAMKGAVGEGQELSTEVVIPATVVKIWDKAFADNRKITKVTFEERDTGITMGGYMFQNATALSEVTLCEGIGSISRDMFNGCTALESITIPASVRSIESNAFFGCVSLEHVNFAERDPAVDKLTIADGGLSQSGDTVKSVSGVFVGCLKLKSIVLPEGTTKIGSFAFAIGQLAIDAYFEDPENADLGLEEIYIPSTVSGTGLGMGTFHGMPFDVDHYGSLIKSDTDIPDDRIISNFKRITFADNCQITSIPNKTFMFSALESIEIPAGVTQIGNSFIGTKNLTTVTFKGNAITNITGVSFKGSSLESITIPYSVTTIAANTFMYCKNLTTVEFAVNGSGNSALKNGGRGANITPPIGNQAFAYSGLESITFPKAAAVYNLGANLFKGCEDLKTVTLSSSITNIENVFTGCRSIEEIVLAEGSSLAIESTQLDDTAKYTTIYNGAAKTGINLLTGVLPETYTLPETVTTVGKNAFEGHTELKHLIVPTTVTSILDYAFSGCTNLTAVTFEGVGDNTATFNNLGVGAFQGCTKLKSVVLPNSLTLIGAHAFEGCSDLSSVTLGNAVTDIRGYAFAETGLTSINLPSTLVQLGALGAGQTGGKTPNPNNAKGYIFYNCKNLASVTFNGPVTTIGYYAFAGCSSLKQITIPQTVTNIASHAFDGAGLTSVTIPAGTVLGSNTFNDSDGTAFTVSTVPTNNVAVFANCANLESVTFEGEVDAIPGYLFSNCHKLSEIFFANGETYLRNEFTDKMSYVGNYAFANTGFQTFAMPYKLTVFGAKVFAGSIDLTDIVLWDDLDLLDAVKSLSGSYSDLKNSYIFEDCESLVNVGYLDSTRQLVEHALPDSLTELPAGMFKGCSSLVNLSIPQGLVVIGEYAFSGCRNYVADNGTFTIPMNVAVLNDYVFEDCDAIKKIIFINPMNDLGEYYSDGHYTYGITAFRGMDALEDIVLPGTMTYIIDYTNGFILKDGVIMWSFPALTKGVVEVPNSVSEIATGAFDGNANLNGIVIGNSVKYIGNHAFRGTGLDPETLELPEDVVVGSAGLF